MRRTIQISRTAVKTNPMWFRNYTRALTNLLPLPVEGMHRNVGDVGIHHAKYITKQISTQASERRTSLGHDDSWGEGKCRRGGGGAGRLTHTSTPINITLQNKPLDHKPTRRHWQTPSSSLAINENIVASKSPAKGTVWTCSVVGARYVNKQERGTDIANGMSSMTKGPKRRVFLRL